MKISKYTLFIFICAIILAILVIFLAAYLLVNSDNRNIPTYPTPTSTTHSEIHYEPTSTQKMLTTLRTRPTLSPTDWATRSKILQKIGGESGKVYVSKTLIIDYVKTADEFEGEIRSDSIDQVKKEADSWLRKQGLSTNGICNLPFVFYVNKKFISKDIPFSPLPLGCS